MNSKARAERRRENRRLNKCSCGAPLDSAVWKSCSACRKAARGKMARRAARRREAGECIRCGGPPEEGFAACGRCRRAVCRSVLRIQRAHRKAGKCKCGRPALPNRAHCPRCKDRAVAREKRRREKQRRNREAGTCGCGAPLTPGKKTCKTCREANRKKTDRRRIPRAA